MSKVSSKLVAGVSKVKAKQAAVAATRKPSGPDANARKPVDIRVDKPAKKPVHAGRAVDLPPTPVWPD